MTASDLYSWQTSPLTAPSHQQLLLFCVFASDMMSHLINTRGDHNLESDWFAWISDLFLAKSALCCLSKMKCSFMSFGLDIEILQLTLRFFSFGKNQDFLLDEVV